jgi:sulfate adenylyltransferase
MVRAVPDHLPENFVLLSDSKVRDMLSGAGGRTCPKKSLAPKVARILMAFYQQA